MKKMQIGKIKEDGVELNFSVGVWVGGVGVIVQLPQRHFIVARASAATDKSLNE